MAILNTQTGYQKPQLPRPPAQYAKASPVARQLSGVSALPNMPASYANPYDNPQASTQFTTPTMPSGPQAPAGTPSTYTQQKPAAPPAPAGYSFDLETDPILQMMHATAAKQRTDAEAGALAQQKQLAIQYGDQAYGNSIDKNTGDAAANNPFSVTANLAGQYQQQTGGPEGGIGTLGENLNAHNLFYSGERIKELAQALHDYQGQQAQAAGAFQQALGGVNQSRIASLIGADQGEQGAYNDAYSRALAAALAGGGASSGPAAPTNFESGFSGQGSYVTPSGSLFEGALPTPQPGPSSATEPTRSLSSVRQPPTQDALLRVLLGMQ